MTALSTQHPATATATATQGQQQSIQSILPETLEAVAACDQLISRIRRSLVGSEPMPDQPAAKGDSPTSMSVKEQLVKLRNAASCLNTRLSELAEDVGDL